MAKRTFLAQHRRPGAMNIQVDERVPIRIRPSAMCAHTASNNGYFPTESRISLREFRLVYSRAEETSFNNRLLIPRFVPKDVAEEDRPSDRSTDIKSVMERAHCRHEGEKQTVHSTSDCVQPAMLHAVSDEDQPARTTTGAAQTLERNSCRHEEPTPTAQHMESGHVLQEQPGKCQEDPFAAQHQIQGSTLEERTPTSIPVPETGSLEHLNQRRERAIATGSSSMANPIQREIAKQLAIQKTIARRSADFSNNRKAVDFLSKSNGSPGQWRAYLLTKGDFSKRRFPETARGLKGAEEEYPGVGWRSHVRLQQVINGRTLALYKEAGVRSVSGLPNGTARAMKMPDLMGARQMQRGLGQRRMVLIRREQRFRQEVRAAERAAEEEWEDQEE